RNCVDHSSRVIYRMHVNILGKTIQIIKGNRAETVQRADRLKPLRRGSKRATFPGPHRSAPSAGTIRDRPPTRGYAHSRHRQPRCSRLSGPSLCGAARAPLSVPQSAWYCPLRSPLRSLQVNELVDIQQRLTELNQAQPRLALLPCEEPPRRRAVRIVG